MQPWLQKRGECEYSGYIDFDTFGLLRKNFLASLSKPFLPRFIPGLKLKDIVPQEVLFLRRQGPKRESIRYPDKRGISVPGDILPMMKAVFLDRDATVNVGVPVYERVNSVDKVQLLPKSLEALKLLAGLDYGVFFITNQAGLAEGLMTIEQFAEINDKVLELITPSGIAVLKTYFCPHGENEGCDCRKPKPKMLFDAAKEYGVDLGKSWMIGDRHSDVMTGINAGTKAILVKTGDPSAKSDEAHFIAPSLLEAVQYIGRH